MTDQPLSVPALRVAVNRLLDAVESQLGGSIAFEVDYYWHVPLDQAYDPDEEPRLDMGQVSDDVDSVHAFAASVDDVVAVWHEAEHIAGVLRAVASRALS